MVTIIAGRKDFLSKPEIPVEVVLRQILGRSIQFSFQGIYSIHFGSQYDKLSFIGLTYCHVIDSIMFNSVFKIIYLVEFVFITLVRKSHTAQVRTLKTVLDRKTLTDMVLLGLAGIGMLTPLVYVFSSILDVADYRLPDWVGWVGVIIFGSAIWFLWRSHAKLGWNWTPTLGIRESGLVP